MAGRLGRVVRWMLALLVVGFAALCVAYTPARHVVLLDAAGTPIAGGYVAYHYRSSVFNFVDSRAWYFPGRLLRTDVRGRAKLPARLAWKSPLHSQPSTSVHFVYASSQHNALRGGLESGERQGVLEVDAERDTLRLHNLAADPARWEASLSVLYSWLRYDAWSDREQDAERKAPRAQVSRADLSPLVASLMAEYRQLLELHGSTARRLPNAAELATWSATGQQERLASLREDLANEPLWGPVLQRRWQRNLQQLADEWEAGGEAGREPSR